MAESKREVAVQALGWGVLFALPAVVCLLRGVVDDPDLGWHLRAGEWMVRQGDWPTVDQFSRWGGGQPWAAYSWLAEGMLWALYRLDGLRGVLLYTGVLASAIVAALWHLLRGCGSDRRLAGVLTLAGAMALVPLGTPRPWLFSILLFIVEMDLLLTAGRSGNRKRLLLLIPLFAVWANLHIQFTLGLAVLGLALVESLVARWARWPWIDAASRALSPGWLALVWGLSVLATLLSPYHAELYRVALLLVGQDRLWAYIQELAAPRFRSPADWLVLAAVLGAAFSLGRCRPVRLLLPMLLMAGAYFGFRSQRDLWVLLVAALATIASCWPQRQKAECEKPAETSAKRPSRGTLPLLGLAAGLATCILGWLAVDPVVLAQREEAACPVQAAAFVARQHYQGPMFNGFPWGGYLIWALPGHPVSIDGRTMVHGQDRVIRNYHTLHGHSGWSDDPELAAAEFAILPTGGPLAELLVRDGRFRRVYRDGVASVFRRTTGESGQPWPARGAAPSSESLSLRDPVQ